jgi:hypothetical protein
MGSSGVFASADSSASNISLKGIQKEAPRAKKPDFLLQEKISKLYGLALEFYDKFPWQSLRALRPFVPVNRDENISAGSLAAKLVDAKLPEDLSGDLAALYIKILAQKQEIISQGSGWDISAEINKEIIQLVYADDFFKVIYLAYERSNPQSQTVSVNVPKGSKSNSFTIQIDPKRVALVEALKLLEKHDLDLPSSTTALTEDPNKGGFVMDLVKKVCPSKPKNKEVRAYEYYLDVYGTKDIPVPGLDPFKAELSEKFGSTVEMPNKIWLADWVLKAGRNSKNAELDFGGTDRYVDLQKHKKIFQYLYQHKEAYQKAAAILTSDHKDLKYSNVLALLYANTFAEFFWMDVEDPWQDKCAAFWYGSKWSGSFAKEYKRYEKERKTTFGYGFESGDNKVYQFPWIIATKFKVPVESQALGPNQVAVGVLLKAGGADNSRLWQKYFPGKVLNIKNVIQAELDPDGSVMALAMEHDYFLERIKTNQNLCVTFPDGQYPPMTGKEEARQYMLLDMSAFFDAFPNTAKNFPDYFPFAHQHWSIDYTCDFSAIMKKVLRINDTSSMEMDFIPNKGFEKHDWLSTAKGFSFKDESSLMVFLKPGQKK